MTVYLQYIVLIRYALQQYIAEKQHSPTAPLQVWVLRSRSYSFILSSSLRFTPKLERVTFSSMYLSCMEL